MAKVMIWLLVLLIVMVQVYYLEALQRFRRVLLAVFTCILAGFFYYALRDNASEVGRYIDRTQATVGEWTHFSDRAKTSAANMKEEDYETLYLEAMLAYEKEDYDIALVYFNQLYVLRPNDLSYYPDYANTLLLVNPRSPQLQALISALLAEPERTLGLWLLFARFEQANHNNVAASQYYDKALGLATPDSPLYSAIQEQRDRVR